MKKNDRAKEGALGAPPHQHRKENMRFFTTGIRTPDSYSLHRS